jgi:glycosyltransferase involved in cell wall biosynthesis/SAM-dependent methyltransferase
MRVAFFSPLPPARSGIADYSEALVESLHPLVELAVFSSAGQAFDPGQFDIAIYQVGNNAHHGFVYETALRHPGVVVMHESNLHHLITDLTIRRGDWDAYIAECHYHGGEAARAFAERVRKLEVGPDYEGVAMTRRLLESARGVIVHSRFMRDETRAAGFTGPVAVIPHGAWIPQADRMDYRIRLGLDGATSLIGIFGFLKPYKRIAESLRAFRRLVRVAPNAKMILVGEPHPELAVKDMIRSMGLEANARVLGFTPIEEFVGYLAACDIVLNLRYPTVGESSGTLLRSLGLGKAVMVSEIGSFQEFPDDVCLKIPVGAGEEDMLFEYLNLLVSRPDVSQALGARAKNYVATECNWAVVARQYADFVAAVASGAGWVQPERASAAAASESTEAPVLPMKEPAAAEDLAPYLHGWAHDEEQRWYLNTHETRLVKTLAITPAGGPDDSVLEMGAYLQITPALKTKLGYGEVRGCYYGELGRSEHRTVVSTEGEPFACDIDLFDAEKDRFPYPDERFSTVVCGELIEHLFADPMHLMSEINRILKPGGHLVLTTPNIASLRGIAAILLGYHPGLFPSYIKPSESGHVDPRHNREYTPREIHQLLENSGFAVTLLETGGFRDAPHPEYGWVLNLMNRYELDTNLRGDGIFGVGRKTGPVRERYPGWLYS